MTWFAVYTQPRAEERALRHLEEQGFRAYLPRYRKRRRHARRVETVLRPLFPRYLFVDVDTTRQRWRSINGTVGAVGMVQFGDRPAPVPPSLIAELRAREDAAGAVSLAPRDLRAGDRVRFTDSALIDRVGLVEDVSDQHRVVLLLDMLGREVRVTATAEGLAAVG